MYAELISPGTQPLGEAWHCIIGDGPKGYNCIPIGLQPTSKPD